MLQEGEFERLGSGEVRRVDVRIVAATNRDLEREVTAGRFREDRYYRLCVYPITMPPLRSRRDDIPLLIQHFTQRFAKQYGRNITEIPGPVVQAALQWDWPGNVRELENVIERTVISSPGRALAMPPELGTSAARTAVAAASVFLPLEELEKSHIRIALDRSRGKIAGRGGAAEMLQIHPNTLRTKMEKFGIKRFPEETNYWTSVGEDP